MVKFYYSSMDAGKSTSLLQTRYNMISRGLRVWCGSPLSNKIESRIGITSDAYHIQKNDLVSKLINGDEHLILIDEAQFLTIEQVKDLCYVISNNVNVYGLRTDFKGNPFPGSALLLSIADIIMEIQTSCFCGDNATMSLRIDKDKRPVTEGEQKLIGHNYYISVCRKHHKEYSNSREVIPG